MTDRLRAAFDRAAAERRAALVAYLTFGDPSPAASIELVAAAACAGADVIELGVPFSDPSADGPSIQHAMERALAAGATLAGALAAIAELRARGVTVPVVVFGYYHPIFMMGPDAFAARATAAGADAALVVDLPLEHAGELAGIPTIPLVAPTSTPSRIARLSSRRAPFVYYISVAGVTGVKAAAPVDPARLAEIRAAAAAPVAVGFGIRSAADAARFAVIADGVVVGSALVDRAAQGPDAIAAFVAELAAAMPRA